MQVRSLGGEGPLAWKIPWTEEPGELQSIRSQSQTQLKQLNTHTHTHKIFPAAWHSRFYYLYFIDEETVRNRLKQFS